MSIIFCIVIAVVAQRWRTAIILALVIGIPASGIMGILQSEETSNYGAPLNSAALMFHIFIGTAAFIAETAAFFGIKLGMRSLRGKPDSDQKLNASEAA